MAISEGRSKGGSIIKTLSVILISFISLPLIVMTIMYFSNEGFRDNANKTLSGLPGGLGGYFQSIPSLDEREGLKRDIAKYYIALDEDRIVDKLLIIKGEDKQLYDDLLVLMTRENSSKMKRVKDSLKLSKFTKDPYNRILTEIDKENEEKIDNMLKYYNSLPLAKAVREIERTHASNEITTDQLTGLFSKLKADQAAKYLFYLDVELERQIKFKLPREVLRDIEKKIEELEANEDKLLELASIYENKNLDGALEELGNTNTYNMEDLAFIYKNLSLGKSSKILSKVDDKDFMLTLFDGINHLEELEKDRRNTSSLVTKGITIYKEYDKKIEELVSIYQRTNIEELSKIIETMLKRNEVYRRHSLNEEEEIIFTEEQLVIDVLNRLKANIVAEILERLNENDRISLSKKLLR